MAGGAKKKSRSYSLASGRAVHGAKGQLAVQLGRRVLAQVAGQARLDLALPRPLQEQEERVAGHPRRRGAYEPGLPGGAVVAPAPAPPVRRGVPSSGMRMSSVITGPKDESGRSKSAALPEWLARLADHIPDPGKHRTHFYAHYANRVRGERPSEELGGQKHEEEQPKKRRCSPSWARLIAKVFQTDPLVCRRCGGPLKVVAYITETVAIRRILDHLGLSPPEKPPPDVREVVRVPVDDQG